MVQVFDLSLVINQLLPEPHAGLLNGILFGIKAQLTPELKSALIATGTLHIVALSGMNITILITLAATTLRRVFSRKVTSLLATFFIIGFILFVGPSASILRAGIMGILSLLSTVFGREKMSIFLLFFTGVVMLLFHPAYLIDLSFQLSFLSTLGIIIFSKRTVFPYFLKGKFGLFWRLIHDDLRTTLSAQVFTTPLLFYTFHRISLVSPVTNVLIGWLIAPLTVLGAGMVVIGFFSISVATPVSWIVWMVLHIIIQIIVLTSRIPYGNLEW